MNPPHLFDSHCHLTDERLRADSTEVIARAREAGVTRIVTVASDPEDAAAALRIAESHENVWCTAGIHPHVAEQANPEAFERIRELATSPRVVALGETGLDFYYDNAPPDVQRASLTRHAELAEELRLPLVIHARAADADMIAFLRAAGPRVAGVLHCFAGGRELLEVGLQAGWYISFAGMVSFRKFEGADLVRAVPLDRLLVETDSPYLAPVPHRGKRNEPAFVRHVAEAVAALRDEPLESLAAHTTANACRLYGIPLDTP